MLSRADACGWAAVQARVRNRASIMARHMFGDEGDGFAHEQVASLLHSLNIAAHEEPWPAGGFHPTPLPTAALADTAAQWAHAFQRDSAVAARQPPQPTRQHEGGWAEEFATQSGDWAAQFHAQAALPPALVRPFGLKSPRSSGKAAEERQATTSATMQGPKWCRRLAFGGCARVRTK
jgi:peroxin-5